MFQEFEQKGVLPRGSLEQAIGIAAEEVEPAPLKDVAASGPVGHAPHVVEPVVEPVGVAPAPIETSESSPKPETSHLLIKRLQLCFQYFTDISKCLFNRLMGPGDATAVSVPQVAVGGMPQPGVALLRRRGKGPALVRPTNSSPLEAPSQPKQVVDKTAEEAAPVAPVNPHDQLKLVVIWLQCLFVTNRTVCKSKHEHWCRRLQLQMK